ncbi:MAG TPA: hypothetical protein VF832_01160 [Longimicrobiales bacterium]
MYLTILEFAVVTLGVKFLLGAALIYYLFPADGRCSACDGDTIPLQSARGLRWLSHASRVERRMCLGCGGTMVARRGGEAQHPRDSVDRARVEKAA